MHHPTVANLCALKRILRYLPTVARSSTKAEYRALSSVDEITWLQMLLKDLHSSLSHAPVALCNNISTTYLAYNHVLHSRSKYIAIDYHFVREKVLLGDLKVQHVPTQLQLADIFTKPSLLRSSKLSCPICAFLIRLSLRGDVNLFLQVMQLCRRSQQNSPTKLIRQLSICRLNSLMQ
ncbi:hypothetical protein LIER_32595 [Lithospermum erythrorhizon]|uniref:Uncharacterized protein n=1 Tax=Lithospermum erythrorhizon TaxID=34254 RepID=A0AAV3RY63_LITER